MDGLLSLLLFAGVFFLMMRFGCGAHMTHGGHGHGNQGDSKSDSPNHKDPVCGMSVDPNEGYGRMQDGHLYRFCSRDCLDKFEAEPARYANKHELEQKR